MKTSIRSASFASVLSVLVLAASSIASGDEAPARVVNDYADLGHMVVTATRRPDVADVAVADLGKMTVTATRLQSVAANDVSAEHVLR
jgi:hypothetical protein